MPHTVVVLTDGANTRGVDPQIAAKEAADRRLRVYTISFGTTTPAPAVCDSSQVDDGSGGGPGGFGGPGGPGGRGGRSPLVADEQTLKQVAATTGGSFYLAENADQLQSALADLPRAISVTREHLDIASWFSGVGGLLVAIAIGLSLWWNRVRRPLGARSGSAGSSPDAAGSSGAPTTG